MLVILLNWLIVIFISYTIGFAVRKFFVSTASHSEIAVTVLWGLFTISVAASLLMFFMPAGSFMLLLFFLAATVIQFFSREEIGKRLNLFRITVAGRREVIFGSLLLFSLLVFSAQPSKINDDGYYYTQTLMWFTQEGFVSGISNLMLPLGLGSSWHVLQALFSFNFFPGLRLNDLNGLLVFIFFVYCLETGFHERHNLVLALLCVMTLAISIPFLSASSPDLPVIILTIIAFYSVWRPFGSRTVADILVLSAFAMSIKLSALPLGLLALALILYSVLKRVPLHRGIYVLLFLGCVVVAAKNMYQTGYPLYPYPWLGIQELSWATPPEVMRHYAAEIKYWGLEDKIYRGPISEWKNPGMVETIQLLWNRGGYKGAINIIILLSFPLIVFTMLRDIHQRAKARSTSVSLIFLHAIFIINFFLWLLLAPQYRFILPVYIFYIAWFIWRWSRPFLRRKFMENLEALPYALIVIMAVVSLVPVSLDLGSTSSHIGNIDPFSFDRVLKPHTSYSFAGVDSLDVGGQSYYHVRGNIYCWDSPLPCMSTAYHKFLRDQGYEIVADRIGGKVEFGLRRD